jgi:hypothetical protein
MAISINGSRMIAAGAMLTLALAAGWACGGGDDTAAKARAAAEQTARAVDNDKAAIETTARAANAARESNDCAAWKALMTDKGYQEITASIKDKSPAGIAAICKLAGTDDFKSVSDVVVDGDTARATETLARRYDEKDLPIYLLYAQRERFRRVDGVWKYDAAPEDISPAVPAGTKLVHVSVKEFSFDFDAAEMKGGAFAIALENVGKQKHALEIRRIPADLDIAKWLKDDTIVDETTIGGSPAVEPGQTYNLVFTSALSPGRYVMLSWVFDAAEELHLEEMHGEFTVS